MNLKQKLYAWRDGVARREGVEDFRVLPNSTLDELAAKRPATRDAMLEIKGIKDRKFAKYGPTLLALLQETGLSSLAAESSAPSETPAGVMSVSAYLDEVNTALNDLEAALVGEISSFDSRANYCFFTLKDKDDESALSCFMWMRDVELSGVAPEIGMEVLVRGAAEVYKPSGRMTFRAHSIELVGEGALKRAYEILKRKLDAEGLFALERKRELPEFPERIGIITSKQGAVIHDLLNNIGAYGLALELIDSRVEGMLAVPDLLRAIRAFSERPIDLLIVIRGGGSLESLQAFNNEHVVRELSVFPVPVICAIGHDKDVPLACLAADAAPSTPTAAAVLATSGWRDARSMLAIASRDMGALLERRMMAVRTGIDLCERALNQRLLGMRLAVERLIGAFESSIERLGEAIAEEGRFLASAGERAASLAARAIEREKGKIDLLERALKGHDPKRLFALGYGILEREGKIVRSVRDLAPGTAFRAELSDGTIDATANTVTPRQQSS
ncbi:MAG TPA: exodeoxyribonuclease VII large subunit [Candidatus Paceibacterota bacterium]|nr:exodeoxyribonuclease VII large subunit [Candidatus Paceibacterota bacterium]